MTGEIYCAAENIQYTPVNMLSTQRTECQIHFFRVLSSKIFHLSIPQVYEVLREVLSHSGDCLKILCGLHLQRHLEVRVEDDGQNTPLRMREDGDPSHFLYCTHQAAFNSSFSHSFNSPSSPYAPLSSHTGCINLSGNSNFASSTASSEFLFIR